MMNEIKHSQINDSRIDEALESYPLVALPDNFMASTMAQIEPRETSAKKMRLQFVDYAVPLFFTSFAIGVIYLLQELVQWDNGYWLLQLETEWVIWTQTLAPFVNSVNMMPVMIGGVMLGFLGLISYIVYSEQASRIY